MHVIIGQTETKVKKKENLHQDHFVKTATGKLKIRSTINNLKRINTGLSEGRFKSQPVVKDGVNVIISKANVKHTGECKPSRLQQVMQRSRSGAYVKNISDISLFTICTMLKDKTFMILRIYTKHQNYIQILMIPLSDDNIAQMGKD